MELRTLMLPAADAATRIVRSVPADRLDAPTPCPEWDVRALINHLVFWTGRAETAARKEAPTGPGEDHDFTREGDWAEIFAVRARKSAEAWTDPAAWEGNTSLSGGGSMAAATIGAMIAGESVLHGWDLAVSTGQRPEFPGELVSVLNEQVASTAEMAREYKVFAAEVPVPESAPVLDRLLGISGRDPHWRP